MGANDVKTMEIADGEKSKKVGDEQSVKCEFRL